jgi:hypothetical protein
MHFIPILSTLVTFSFAVAVFTRYLKRHHTHLLIWTIGLLFYGIGTLSEVILGLTFSAVVLKFWYLSGAMMAAAWLGEGTIHLLVRKHGVALTLTIILAILSGISAVLVFTSPLTSASASYQVTLPISSQYKDILTRSGFTLFLTILLNIYGTLALVGGAIYSVIIFLRKHVLIHRMIGSIFIAVGGIAPAMAGSFVNLGMPDLLYLSELLGAILMYIGFLQATSPVPAKQAAPAPANSPAR